MADNIKQFESPIDKLAPSETGAETLARMGRVEKENYDEAGRSYGNVAKEAGSQIGDWEYMHEVSQGSAALAVMHNNMATAWNGKLQSTDANDMSIQQKFMDDSTEQLNSWKEGFQTKRGQEWATSQADSMSNHLWDKTSADMGSRAGNAIVNNMKTTVNNLSEAARKDPTTIDQALSHIDAAVSAQKEGANGYLNEAELNRINDVSADMKNEVVKSGLQGLADVNPEAAMKAIDSPAFTDHLKPGEAEQLKKYSEGVVRMKQEDVTRAYENQRRAQTERDEQASTKIINGMYDPESGKLNVPDDISQQIWQMPGVSGKTKLQLLGAAQHISKEDNKEDDSDLIRENASRLRSDSANPLTKDDLLGQLAAGKMKTSTYNFFNGQLKDTQDTKDSNDIMNQALAEGRNSILGPSTGIAFDPATEQSYSRFQADFLSKYRAAMSDPKILPGASLTQKAAALTDPKSSISIVPDGYYNQFKPTGNDVVRASLWDRLFGSSPAAKPAQAPSKPPPAPANVPAPGSPDRAAFVKSMIFGNGPKP